MKAIFARVQQLGRALMLPIAVLPIAGLLLRLGQPDLLDIAPIAAAGDAIFSNLGLLFAIGVAVGLARENHGAAGLAAVVGYLVATKGAEVLIAVPETAVAGLSGQANDLAVAAYKARELAKLSVPVGIISGVLGGVLYNRYSNIRLPDYLAFFAGRRFVAIASGVAGLVVAAAFGLGWPVLEAGMDLLSRSVVGAGDWGLFAYGVLNRVLIVTGLHHILNNVAWFLLGDFNGVTGDLRRFFAGDPHAGAFMAGFFPVMMFGLPAACLAMYHAARPERRRAVAGLFFSMALTSFLTGITEPIEFTFMFLAPVLYAVHALLTGASMVIMNVLGSKLGFSFSAGLFDYVLNFSRSTHPLVMLPVGLAYFALYYGLFRFFIAALNLQTPGRAPEDGVVAPQALESADTDRGRAFVEALGGPENLQGVDACTTRLRLVVGNGGLIDTEALKRLGMRGLVRPSENAVQIVLGPMADQVAGEIRAVLHAGADCEHRRSSGPPAPVVPAPPSSSSERGAGSIPAEVAATWAPAVLRALGGEHNIRALQLAASRLRVSVKDAASVNDAAFGTIGLRGFARPSPECVHLIVGPTAALAYDALNALVRPKA